MSGTEALVGELGNIRGISARIASVGRVGEEHFHHFLRGNVIGRRVRALHLVVNYAVVAEIACLGDLIVPALLAEYALVLECQGVEHRVHINVHKIVEIAVVSRRNGVDRLVVEGHSVKEGLERALQKVNEGLFKREFIRSAEHRVLHNVKYAGVIVGQRFEADSEGFVRVVSVDKDELRAGFFVLHLYEMSLDGGDLSYSLYLKAVNKIAFL